MCFDWTMRLQNLQVWYSPGFFPILGPSASPSEGTHLRLHYHAHSWYSPREHQLWDHIHTGSTKTHSMRIQETLSTKEWQRSPTGNIQKKNRSESIIIKICSWGTSSTRRHHPVLGWTEQEHPVVSSNQARVTILVSPSSTDPWW